MGKIKFLDENGSFRLEGAENYSGLYFPVAQNLGMKSALTPNLGGDTKQNQNAFLLEPVSVENLNNNRGVRNFWVKVSGKGVWSAVGASAKQEAEKFSEKQDESAVEAGFMWQTASRKSAEFGLKSEVISFAPIDYPVEVMFVTITNESTEDVEIRPTAAVPIYGRSADNIRDHRHVTSLLHRIKTDDYGVLVTPTLSFDERGHRKNELTYFISGITGTGEKPVDFYPVMDDFMGEGGSLIHPVTVLKDIDGVPSGSEAEGKEAMGGIHFAKKCLKSGESVSYTIIMGITEAEGAAAEIKKTIDALATTEQVCAELKKAQDFWKQEVNVSYETGSKEFDGFMKWISFQPMLRRIYGCSFLPHHDYGRGGRGWRDLWQDCLSLLIMDPGNVRQMILDNYGGVRIDGTNATIIGEKQGEFVADRNGIARVWMDHGFWPYLTTKLYIDQTGDVDILKETATYFKDEQKERGTALDKEWDAEYGVKLRSADGAVYQGTIFEHILLEQLCSFYEVGSHNHMRLRGADWNDALDMAAANGESVAFTAAYAGNLTDLADMLELLETKYGWTTVSLLKEIEVLLQNDAEMYDDIAKKTAVLAAYTKQCGHTVSGEKVEVAISTLAASLREKADWIKEHIRKTEWIEGKEHAWFNSYYDNSKNRVEGEYENGVRMMLTGQVFTIMSGTATEEQVRSICESADAYLYKRSAGGYRLNTDFHEVKLDLGRMFGFAYGEKENGAVFSHMTVMYANALYKRGFVKEGYKALSTLFDAANDFETSKIYPGIPEYFDANGRGLYHYLTGAASWYMLTVITEMFGVKGNYGALTIAPKLVKEQFDESGKASLKLTFAGKKFNIIIENENGLEADAYKVAKASIDGEEMDVADGAAILPREVIEKLSDDEHEISISLQ